MADLQELRTFYANSISLYLTLKRQYLQEERLIKMNIEKIKVEGIEQDNELVSKFVDLKNVVISSLRESTRINNELNLKRSYPDLYSLPYQNTNEVVLTEIMNVKKICEQSMMKMRELSEELKDLRKKWWKIW